jgi:hypothetical protein
MSVQNDPRWLKLHQQGVRCTCGEVHKGLFALNVLVPLGYTGHQTPVPDDQLKLDRDSLTDNYCVRGGQYFALRVRLPIPLAGAREHALLYTAWVSLNRPDFEGYIGAQRTGQLKAGAMAQARLVNRLAGYDDTFRMMGLAAQQLDGPPYFLVDEAQEAALAKNPLIQEQRQGATLDRILEIYAANNHDMRPGLASS